jgi:capsular polysaccharide transport system ATP-binding protein
MSARLAFGVSLAMKFDCYLIDEGTAAGDERFRARSQEELFKKLEKGSLIMTSHDPHTLERFCDRGAVLYAGNLTFYDSVAEACEVHHALQMRAA